MAWILIVGCLVAYMQHSSGEQAQINALRGGLTMLPSGCGEMGQFDNNKEVCIASAAFALLYVAISPPQVSTINPIATEYADYRLYVVVGRCGGC